MRNEGGDIIAIGTHGRKGIAHLTDGSLVEDVANHANPNTALFVQINPSYYCPSLVTEAMTNQIKRITGIPEVTITSNGTEEYKNDIIIPYLQERVQH